MPEERRIRTVFEVDGAETAAQAVERLADAFTETERAEIAAQSIAQFEAAIAEAEQTSARFAASQTTTTHATGEFGTVARESTQQAIQFTQKLSAASGALQGLAANIGLEGDAAGTIGRVAALTAAGAELGGMFGPQGAVVGGIAGLATATIPQLIEALFGVPEAQEAVEESTRAARIELEAEAEAARDALTELNAFLAAASTAGRRRAAQEGAEAIRGLVAERDRLRGTGRAIDALEAQELEGRIRRLSDDVQAELDEIASEEAQLRASAERRGGGGRDRAREYEEFRDLVHTLTEEGAAFEREIERRREEEGREHHRRKIEQLDKEDDVRQEKHERELQRMRDAQAANELLIEANREAYEKSREDTRETADLIDEANRGIAKAIAEVIAGEKSAEDAFRGMLASFLEAIAEQAMTKAGFEYAEAAAAFARYDFGSAVGHVGAGLAYTAVAIGTGLAAGAVAPPAAGSQQPDSPDRAGAGASGQGAVTYVTNWQAPVISAGTEADTGRMLRRLDRRATQRYGRLAA